MEILLQYFTFLLELFQSLLIYLSVTHDATIWLWCSCLCYPLSVHVKHPAFQPHPTTWLSVFRTPPSCSCALAHAVCQSQSSVHSKTRAHLFFMPHMFPCWYLGSTPHPTSTVDPVHALHFYECHTILSENHLFLRLLSSPCGESNGTPLQYSCLENPMDGGAWWATVREVAKSRTWLSDFTFTFHFHALEKEMATRSSVLAWRIPGTGSLVGCRLWGRTELDTTEAT